MKKNTLIGLVIVIGLIGVVLFKNIYKLNKRIDKEAAELHAYENDLLTVDLPRNLTYESDTTYLENGEIFNTVYGVAGSSNKNGNIVRYSLSIARYSKELTIFESFRLDTLRKNLNKRFVNSDLQLFYVHDVKIEGIRGLRYLVRKGEYFEKSIMFSLDNNVIAINMRGTDSVNITFDEIIKSVKIRNALQ